eukprot:Gb_22949 [translate_table: standard]
MIYVDDIIITGRCTFIHRCRFRGEVKGACKAGWLRCILADMQIQQRELTTC